MVTTCNGVTRGIELISRISPKKEPEAEGISVKESIPSPARKTAGTL